MKKLIILIFKIIVVIFAIAGFGLLASYVAVSLHWTDTKGIIDNQSSAFWNDGKIVASISGAQNNNSGDDIFFNKKNYCFMKAVKKEYPGDFTRIFNLAINDKKDLAQKNLDALKMILDTNPDEILSDTISSCNSDNFNVSKKDFEILADAINSKSPFVWANSDEWNFFKTSVLKDKSILDKIQKETGIDSRILVSQLTAEQMRLFYSDRPWFKEAIAPLKVLGSMTQFSWGIFGIKPETAMRIEDNLKNPNSDFYLGLDYEKMLDFQSENIQQERFNRITDNNNHYYAYLYAALYDKEIITQWQKSGFDVSNRPEILATLFNIGFDHSKPNSNPQIGGAELQVGDSTYSFGRLASEFYYSGELLNEFPQSAPDNKKIDQTDLPTNNVMELSANDSLASLTSFISTQGAQNWQHWINFLFPLTK